MNKHLSYYLVYCSKNKKALFYFLLKNKGQSGGALSEMSIDDVKLEYGVCSNFGACTFENFDYCAWSNVDDVRDDFDWEFGTGLTNSQGTGPSVYKFNK